MAEVCKLVVTSIIIMLAIPALVLIKYKIEDTGFICRLFGKHYVRPGWITCYRCGYSEEGRRSTERLLEVCRHLKGRNVEG